LGFIKERSINNKIDTLISSLKGRKVIVKPIKSVVIINNPASNFNQKDLRNLEKVLHLDSDDFDIFSIKKKNDSINKLRGVVATIDSFTVFGAIKNPEIKLFLDKKYDLLIDFTHVSNVVEKYFSLAIQADFRVGYQNEEEIYDLMLKLEDDNIGVYVSEMMRYLKIIGLSK